MAIPTEADGVVLVSVRRYHRWGYEVHHEKMPMAGPLCCDLYRTSAYTVPEGHYIGWASTARKLCVVRGIKPQSLRPHAKAENGGRGALCSFGFSEKNGVWYVWDERVQNENVFDTELEATLVAKVLDERRATSSREAQ